MKHGSLFPCSWTSWFALPIGGPGVFSFPSGSFHRRFLLDKDFPPFFCIGEGVPFLHARGILSLDPPFLQVSWLPPSRLKTRISPHEQEPPSTTRLADPTSVDGPPFLFPFQIGWYLFHTRSAASRTVGTSAFSFPFLAAGWRCFFFFTAITHAGHSFSCLC